jgi:hypothetical protein
MTRLAPPLGLWLVGLWLLAGCGADGPPLRPLAADGPPMSFVAADAPSQAPAAGPAGRGPSH